jgi:nitrite reductase/ring-hydroxylating ferredoxin subunit
MNADDRDQPRRYPDGQPLLNQPVWTRDCPTDTPDDEQVARREFIKFMVLTSGAFATGQCWIALMGQPLAGPFPRVKIATLTELQAKRVVEFRYPTEHDPCLLFALASNKVAAYGQKCPHLACAVVPKLDRGELVCPCHNGHFEIASGRPISGPARRPLPVVTVEVQGDEIYATGVEPRTV